MLAEMAVLWVGMPLIAKLTGIDNVDPFALDRGNNTEEAEDTEYTEGIVRAA